MGSFNYKSFLDTGLKVQDKFQEALIKHCGGTVEPASKKDDIHKHVDLWWIPEEEGKRFGIDVKGLKKEKRSDKETNSDIHWVEIYNVNGSDGWLLGQESYIAFETLDSWALITPSRVLDIIKENVKNEEITNNGDEIFRLYRRKGRKDVVVKIPTSYIIEKANKIIDKI